MELADSGITAVQLPPAQIKAFAPSWGRLTKTDRFDTELIARYMAFRPKAGKELPDENLSILRTLKTRRGQLVDMRKWLKAQISARNKQGISADVEIMDDELRETFDTQIDAIERRIEDGIAQVETLADKANLLRSMPPPGIGPVSAAVLIAELPELGRMTSGEAAAMIGFAPVPHDSGAMRGGERLRAGDGRYGMFCSKRHSPPPATTQFSSQSPSVSRSAGNYTDSSLS